MIQFTSDKASPIIMFEDNAIALLKMMGVTGIIPAAVNCQDLTWIISNLKKELTALQADELITLKNDLKPDNVDENLTSWDIDTEKEAIEDVHSNHLSQSAIILLEMLESIQSKGGFLQWDYT